MLTVQPASHFRIGGSRGSSASLLFSYDADAAAFFTRASITDATQKSAWNSAVVSLKGGANLWAKMELLYPLIGGSATPHSKNAKSDTFNITWSGTVTHDANGITGDAATGWGDSGWATASASIATQDSVSIGVYCRTETPTDGGRFLGTSNNSGASKLSFLRSTGNLTNEGPHDATQVGTPSLAVATDFHGTLCMTRTAAAVTAMYARALTPGTGTQASVSTTAGTLGILARNYEGFGPDNFSDANLAFVFAGGGLSDAEYAELNGIIKTFQAALGRNVAD